MSRACARLRRPAALAHSVVVVIIRAESASHFDAHPIGPLFGLEDATPSHVMSN